MYNQIVKVLRLAGNPAYPEPCYLIELPDKTRAELLCSWAVPATSAELSPASPPPEDWAGVSEYLALVQMVKALRASSPLEETQNEYPPQYCTSDRDPNQRPARLGSNAPGLSEGPDSGAGSTVAKTAPTPGNRAEDERFSCGRTGSKP